MTASIFESWLRMCDLKLSRDTSKIALFVDNCSAHPHVSGLDCIELIFSPSNTTNEMQPCEHGIIKTLKTCYRKSMVKHLLRSIDSGATSADFKITLLDGLQMARNSWKLVSQSAIANCFTTGGLAEEK